MPTANEILLDRLIRHQHFIERFSGGAVKQLVGLLSKVEDDIAGQIAKRNVTGVAERYQDKRLALLLSDIRDLNREAITGFREGLYAQVRELASHEAEFTTELAKNAVPVNLDLIRPNANTVHAAVFSRPFQGRILSEWVKDLEPRTFTRLRDAIRMGVVEGETVDQLIRRVRGTRKMGYRDGVMEMTRRGAATLVRTAVNHTVTAAREATYRENDAMIKGVQWVATLDHATCPVCGGRDGEVYDVGKGPRPPAHPGCRCSSAPVLRSWRELGINLDEAPEGTRAAMGGQVPEKTTYGQWLRRQPAGVQDEALGKTKGALFRRGDLKIDAFSNRAGHIYTVDELRAREAAAFREAGIGN